MTPKEKALELFNKLYFIKDENGLCRLNEFIAKQCTLIIVDEIIVSSPSLPVLGDGGTYGEDIELSTEYWKEVKEELKKKLW